MSAIENEKSVSISLIDKLCLKQYSFLVNYIIAVLVLEKTSNPLLSFFLIFIYTYLGPLLPRTWNKPCPASHIEYHNKSVFPVIYLLLNCLCIDLFLNYFWKYLYSQVCTSPVNVLGAIMTIVFVIGFHIDVCHNLIHRNQWALRTLGHIQLSIFQFTTYPLAHLKIHHKFVGSHKDPITSPKNRTIYEYFLKAIAFTYRTNYQHSTVQIGICVLLNLGYILLLSYAAFREGLNLENGIKKVLFFLLAGYTAVFATECIEYVEHYGLVYRQSNEKGIEAKCSWNSAEGINADLINQRFQSHSDHHLNVYRVFTALQLDDTMPQYPFTFLDAFLMCLLPPLWMKVANPLVDEVIEGKTLTKQHLKFAKSAALITSWSATLVFGIVTLDSLNRL